MRIPKYAKVKGNRYLVLSVNFSDRTTTLSGIDEQFTSAIRDVDFDYSDMDLDDMYEFLRAIYPPSGVVKEMCKARNDI